LCALPARADEWGDDAAAPPAAPGRFDHQPPLHPYRLGLGTGLLVQVASKDQSFLDMDGSENVLSVHNLSAAFASQLTPTWGAGLRVAYSSGQLDEFDPSDHELWQLAAEARWQPEGALGPYAVASAGGVAAVDNYGDTSTWQWAPALGGALGFDVALAGPVALGFELRALAALFPSNGGLFTAERADSYVNYGLTSWLSLNMIATLGLGERRD
jgi:hypothetical protein